MSGTAMIVDGNNLLVRCIKAMEYSGLRNGENWQTGPLTAFIGALGRLTRLCEPSALVVCWDAGPSVRRKALYDAYKAARAENPSPETEERKETAFGMAKTFLKACRIQQVAVQGYEADDVVAAYWAKCRDMDSVIIISGDKDFLQLVGANTVQLRPDNAGTYKLWDEGDVYVKYGCTPSVLPLMMALMGDPIDGVPGVRGLGPKKALRGLEQADWTLERVPALEDPQKLADARLSLALVDLTDASFHPDVPALKPFEPLHPSEGGACLDLVNFLRSLEMETVLNRFYTDTLWK